MKVLLLLLVVSCSSSPKYVVNEFEDEDLETLLAGVSDSKKNKSSKGHK
jgi:uncharacterized protein YcfL